MRMRRKLMHGGLLLVTLTVFFVGAVSIAPTDAFAFSFSVPNPVGDITDRLKEVLSDVASKYVENPAGKALESANNAANFAAAYNYDGVADEVIQAMVARASLDPFITTLESKLIPAEIRVYTGGAASVLRVMDTEIGAFKTQTYKSLYATYKNDINALATATQSGDFSPFYRYCLFYGIATADWSNPEAAKASALNIARDQYAAYQWYSSHTMKGAVIGTARTQAGDRAGLTDEAIASGAKGIANQFQSAKDQGMLGALIAAWFVKVAKESQCAANPVYCPQPGQRLCGASSEQHTVSVGNHTNQTVFAKVRVVSTQTHCENHICDMSGPLKPGESRLCAVYGRRDDGQVRIWTQIWDPRGSNADFRPVPSQSDFPPIQPREGNPAIQTTFDKASRNAIHIGLAANGVPTIDGNYPPQVPPDQNFWASQPPANPLRDDNRDQIICAPMERTGIGYAHRDSNGTWYCTFGHGGNQYTYNYHENPSFVFLRVAPGDLLWREPGAGFVRVPGGHNRPVTSFTRQDIPACRGWVGRAGAVGWQFGWVWNNSCVVGLDGQSPSMGKYEILYTR